MIEQLLALYHIQKALILEIIILSHLPDTRPFAQAHLPSHPLAVHTQSPTI